MCRSLPFSASQRNFPSETSYSLIVRLGLPRSCACNRISAPAGVLYCLQPSMPVWVHRKRHDRSAQRFLGSEQKWSPFKLRVERRASRVRCAVPVASDTSSGDFPPRKKMSSAVCFASSGASHLQCSNVRSTRTSGLPAKRKWRTSPGFSPRGNQATALDLSVPQNSVNFSWKRPIPQSYVKKQQNRRNSRVLAQIIPLQSTENTGKEKP
jgi:hypothetical protein